MSAHLGALAFGLAATVGIAALHLGSAWAWQVRLAGTVVLFALLGLAYLETRESAGFPAAATPPERFELLHAEVVEPDRARASDGAIYLWVRDRDLAGSLPRAHRLPYTRALHEEIEGARQRARDGHAQGGTRGETSGDGAGGTASLRLHDLPRRALPPK